MGTSPALRASEATAVQKATRAPRRIAMRQPQDLQQHVGLLATSIAAPRCLASVALKGQASSQTCPPSHYLCPSSASGGAARAAWAVV
ncbi:hypothetical protein PG995_014982 [Apiospora arundinis]